MVDPQHVFELPSERQIPSRFRTGSNRHPDICGGAAQSHIEIIRIDIFSKQATSIRRYFESLLSG
jgi:hypothetical protein